MKASVQLEQWQSNFFGRKIGVLHFGGEQPFMPQSMVEYDLIQAKVAQQDRYQSDFLRKQGFQQVADEVQWRLDIANYSPNLTGCLAFIRVAFEQDLPILRELVGQAFVHSRFCSPWFSSLEQQRFYQCWIEQAVAGRFDDICFISQSFDQQLQGAITLKGVDDGIKIGLLAIAPEFQRQGIARLLINLAVKLVQLQHKSSLWITTQLNNRSAMQLYQQCGAEIVAINNWFYR